MEDSKYIQKLIDTFGAENVNVIDYLPVPFEGEPETVVEALNFIGRTLTLIYNELIEMNRSGSND